MAQFARPDSDVAFAMLGGHSVNTAGNRYQNIDESVAADTDYVYTGNNPGGSASGEFGLSNVTDPAASTGHVLRIRTAQIDQDSDSHPYTPNTGGTATTCAWELRQGATIIASGSINPAGWATTTYNLTGAEADAITDYTDLRVFVNPSGGAGSPASRRGVAVSWIELEVPDAPIGNNFQHSESGSIGPSGSLTKQAGKNLTASVGPSGALSRRTSRALAATLGLAGAIARKTARGISASVSFSTSFSASIAGPATPALTARLIHPES